MISERDRNIATILCRIYIGGVIDAFDLALDLLDTEAFVHAVEGAFGWNLRMMECVYNHALFISDKLMNAETERDKARLTECAKFCEWFEEQTDGWEAVRMRSLALHLREEKEE